MVDKSFKKTSKLTLIQSSKNNNVVYRNVGLFECMNKINASMVKTLILPKKKKTRDESVTRNNVDTDLLTISQRARAIPVFYQ